MCSGRIQKFARNHKLKGNDKESCSLMLLMDIVEVGGTAIGILKEGVYFTKAYKDLRRCLIENFNVREIISIPSDQFENTSTKTSIVIFDNTELKTSEVIFSNLVVERYTEDKFAELLGDMFIIENKDDIKKVSDVIITRASKQDILTNKICSLNSKEYNKKEIICGEGYELVKLNDICQFNPKSKRKASYGKQIGKYNFYSSSDKVKKCDIADYTEECLIIGNGGVANIKIDNIFSCSSDNFIIKSINNKYIYYLFKGCMDLLSDVFIGSVLKHLSTDYLKNLKIPIPTSQIQIQEWVDRISKPYDEKNMKQTQIKELEKFIQNRIKYIVENEDCNEVKLEEISDINIGSTPDTKNYKYWEMGTIPWVAISDMDDKIVYNTKKCLTELGAEKMKSRKIPRGSILLSFKLTIGTLGISGLDNMFCNEAITYLNSKHKEIHQMYLYHILNMLDIKQYGRGTIGSYGNLNKDILKNIKLKIPKNKQLIKDLEPTFNQIETLQNEVKNADTLYKQLIQELSNEAIPPV